MQLNDSSDYSVAVGKTDGLIPSPYKGRGLISFDRVYEFQTAYCSDEDTGSFIRHYSALLADKYAVSARKIPVLPQVVSKEFVSGEISTLSSVPIGVSKKQLNIATVNLENKVVFPVAAQDINEASSFIRALASVVSKICDVKVVDAQNFLDYRGETVAKTDYVSFVAELFNEAVKRNNTFKDADMDIRSMDAFEEKVYIIYGFRNFFDVLDNDSKEKLLLAIEKNEAVYKMKFIIADSVAKLTSMNFEEWYKKHITGAYGVWIGEGFADQYVLKINKVTSDLYEEIGNNFGYVVNKNRPFLIKLLSDEQEDL